MPSGEIHIIHKEGAGEGTIVFLHGNSSSSEVFAPSLEEGISNYNLLSLDFPGHGRSCRSEDRKEYSIERMKEAALAAIKETDGKVLLAGNSLGGHIALEIVPETDRLQGLVIFGTPPVRKPLNLAEAFLPNPAVNTYFREDVADHELDAMLEEAVFVKSVIPQLKKDFLLTDPQFRTSLAGDLSSPDVLSDETALFASLEMPKFVIHGQQDPFVSLQYIDSLKNETDFEIILMADCGHYPSLERPAEFNDHLERIAAEVFG